MSLYFHIDRWREWRISTTDILTKIAEVQYDFSDDSEYTYIQVTSQFTLLNTRREPGGAKLAPPQIRQMI